MQNYLKAREELLAFFLKYMYPNNTGGIYDFSNDVRHLIERFNKYFPDDIFEFMITYPDDALILGEELRHNVDDEEIYSIKKSIKVIEEYLDI